MICFLEKNREEKSNSHSWAGHRVSGFECAETFLKGTAKGGEERDSSGLQKPKCLIRTGLMRGLVWKREEALICGDGCYIIHLQ